MTGAPALPRRPLGGYFQALGLLVLVLAAGSALDWDLGALVDARERSLALTRLRGFLGAFGAPDLSREALAQGFALSLQTLSVSVWGMALGVVLGYALALFATRAVMIGDASPTWPRRPAELPAALSWGLRRVLLETARLALDVLRGVPDFAWALLILTIPGPGPVTGVLALGMSVGGILGKIYSELWDSIDPRRYESLRTTGASRLGVFLFAIQPLAGRSMLSFTLMRGECAVRNASVIGVVGGGGLGAQLFDEFNYGNYGRVVLLLLFLVGLTASADLASNFIRHQLRSDPNHPRAAPAMDIDAARGRRRLAAGLVGLGLLLAGLQLRPALARALGEIEHIEWAWIGENFGRFLRPDLGAQALLHALASARVPLAMALLSTLAAMALAATLAYPASTAFQLEPSRFTGERTPRLARFLRAALFGATRGTSLLLRSVPEVAWLLLLAACFRIGVLPGVLALALHSSGVLARVFVESLDNLPYRRFEHIFLGSRFATFLYAGVPGAAREWLTYSLFQFESNVRTGLVLGIIGVGGLGDSFHSAYESWSWNRAGTYLLAMVLITTLIDRSSRALHLRRTGND